MSGMYGIPQQEAPARENAQPLVLNYVKGTLGLAHNGNLINAPELRRELAYTGAIFQTTIDSEVIAYHIARERLNTSSVEEAVGRAMGKLKGAYSLVVMSPRKLIGARDSFGFRPLCIGKRDNAYLLASESCALDTVGAEFVRDVLPGEIVTISPEYGIQSDMSHALPEAEHARCVFEYIYFARPDSILDGESVYHSRIMAGKYLAMDSPVEADLVVGRAGIRKLCGSGIFLTVRYSLRNSFCEKCLCGQNLYQAKAEKQGKQCAGKAESHQGGSGGQADYHDRRLDCQGNHLRQDCPDAQGGRRKGGPYARQLPALFMALLFRNGCTGKGAVDCLQTFCRGNQ